MYSCIDCGGEMIGDGYTTLSHCEYADIQGMDCMAPDEGPLPCGYKDSNKEPPREVSLQEK
jgi:hypothetical protein